MIRLRAGIVGLGVMGRHHLRVLRSLDGVDLVGVFDPALGSVSHVADVPVYSSLESLLDLGLDYCVLAAPTSLHLQLGLKLAERGIHTLIEKPVAVMLEDARILVKAFTDRNLIGGVGHVERFNPAIQALRQKLSDGLIGEVYQVATRRQGPFPGRISDVGVIKDLATHDIDLTMWITNRNYKSITAHSTHRSGSDHEDMVVAIGKLEDGVIVSHLVNWLTPFKERCTTVIGELGALVADTLTADLTFFENGTQGGSWDGVSLFRGVSEGEMMRFALTKVEPLLSEHIAFRDAVKTGRTSQIVSLAQGTEAVRVAELISLSSRS